MFSVLCKEKRKNSMKMKRERKDAIYGLEVTGAISIGSLFRCRRESSVISDSRNSSFHGRTDWS